MVGSIALCLLVAVVFSTVAADDYYKFPPGFQRV